MCLHLFKIKKKHTPLLINPKDTPSDTENDIKKFVLCIICAAYLHTADLTVFVDNNCANKQQTTDLQSVKEDIRLNNCRCCLRGAKIAWMPNYKSIILSFNVFFF